MPFIALILFIAVPIIEIAIFIQVGDLIGLWPTLGCIVLTAVIGAALIRIQGFAALNQAQQATARDELPVEPVIHGVFLLMAGALLLTPGFFTDTIGFLLLVPALRLSFARWIWSRIVASDRVNIHMSTSGPRPGGARRGGRGGPIIEGEIVEEDEDDRSGGSGTGTPAPRGSSPWHR